LPITSHGVSTTYFISIFEVWVHSW
jgi:hypothetical protein